MGAFLYVCALLAAAPFYSDKLDLMVYRDASGAERAVASPQDWAVRRAHLLENMQAVMGYLPPDTLRVPLDVQVLEEVKTDRYVRRKITYASEPGDRVPAYVLIPLETRAPAPAMVCLHQTTQPGKAEPAGLEGSENLHYAQELAERGCVCIAPDYPRFGDYSTDPYTLGYASATAKGIWNHMRAVDVLEDMREVDPARIGCIGHSLGGHNTLFLAVFDPRIKVAVTSCGFTRFAKYYGGDLTGWSHRGYMPRIDTVFDRDPAKMPFDFPDILAAIAPRRVFINAPVGDDNFDVTGVKESVAAAEKIFALHNVPEHIVAVYPDSKHDFPPETRKRAYRFLDTAFGVERR